MTHYRKSAITALLDPVEVMSLDISLELRAALDEELAALEPASDES